MKLKVKKHLWYYISFIGVQILGWFLVVLTASDRPIQLSVIVITTFFYMFLALLHQYAHHHLTTKIVVEYALVGVLGLTLSFFLLSL